MDSGDGTMGERDWLGGLSGLSTAGEADRGGPVLGAADEGGLVG